MKQTTLPDATTPPNTIGIIEEAITEPTDTDVLLGRGVSTNRHPGNINFRNVVSQHVNVYVTSTKKQKMMISRSIVDKVHNDLDPPGRFLEKDSSGLWFEVGMKKALEKTSQALRDGAFPLRKQLSEDMSDPTFLAAVFDTNDNVLADAPKPAVPRISSTDKKGHRRLASAPVVQMLPVDFDLPDSKRSKPSSPYYQEVEDLNLPFGQNLTGVNFPSPAISFENEFQIGSTDVLDPAKTVKNHHRRNHTFGGYSCSDSNVSDMSIDDIFALFLGTSGQQANGQQQNQKRQQQAGQHNTMPSDSFLSHDVSELFRAPMTSPSREYISHVSASPQLYSDPTSFEVQEQNSGFQNVVSRGSFVGRMPVVQDNSIPQLLVAPAASYSRHHQQSHPSSGVENSDASMPELFSSPSLNWQSESSLPQQHLSQDPSVVSFGQNIVTTGIFDACATSGVQGQQQLQQNDGVQNLVAQENSIGDVTMGQDYALAQRFVSQPACGNVDQQQLQQSLGGENMALHLTQLLSSSTPSQLQHNSGAHNVSCQENVVVCSPQPSDVEMYQANIAVRDSPGVGSPQSFIMPVPSKILDQEQLEQQALCQPNLPFTVPTQFSNSNSEYTLSGVKRHRRSNTIANGDCFSSQRSTNVTSYMSGHHQEVNYDFSNNMHGVGEPLTVKTRNTRSIGVGQTSELQFHDFSHLEIPELPLREPNPTSTMRHHRRLNTTGHLADVPLPQDWNFSFDKPAPLKTIHEDIPIIPLTHECGSMMSSNAGTADSATPGIESHPMNSSYEKSPSASSMKAFLDALSPINAKVSEPDSTKSSLSTEDFCSHMMAAYALDGEDNGDTLLIVDDKKLINDWHADRKHSNDGVEV
eukprot:CCRYP_006974-RA/>CCRYP_006974-RA protein AED:0.30 eAED:-0.27 QI:0/0/0/1/1/1/2/0/863